MSAFIERLVAARIGATFNFYRDGDGAALRCERLDALPRRRARAAPYLLVGEAAGYRGARVSGIPFTSERQLTGAGPAEATATIVHRVLAELGVEDDVLLWNVVPTHPGPRRRTAPPTRAEVAAGVAVPRRARPRPARRRRRPARRSGARRPVRPPSVARRRPAFAALWHTCVDEADRRLARAGACPSARAVA